MTISVVLVDDQPLLRLGFRMVLDAQQDMRVVAEAGDGEEAVRVVAQHQPDVVLMDVRMPRLDGVEATRRIVTSGSRSRVLILTMLSAPYQAMTSGPEPPRLAAVTRSQPCA